MSTKPLNDEHSRAHYPDPSSNTQRAEVNRWCCMNCGQHVFVVVDNQPPDICEYCKDMTTWRLVRHHT